MEDGLLYGLTSGPLVLGMHDLEDNGDRLLGKDASASCSRTW